MYQAAPGDAARGLRNIADNGDRHVRRVMGNLADEFEKVDRLGTFEGDGSEEVPKSLEDAFQNLRDACGLD